MIVGVTFFMFLLTPTVMNLFTSDPPIDDSDLRTNAIKLSDQDNAYFDLLKLKESGISPADYKQISALVDSKQEWNQEAAKALVQKYAETYEHFSRAASKPGFQYPISPNHNLYSVFGELSEFMSGTVNWFKLASLHSKLLAKTGQHKEAINEAMKTLRIAKKIQGPDSPILLAEIGSAITGGILKEIQGFLEGSSLASGDLIAYVAELNQYQIDSKEFKGLLKYQYHFLNIENLIDEVDVSGPLKLLGAYYLKKNQTKLLLANFFRAEIEAPNTTCGIKANGERNRGLETTSLISKYFNQNAIGEELVASVAFQFERLLTILSTSACKTNFLISATQAMMGIKAYKMKNSDLPDSLDQLVPAYLSAVPLDPYSGQAIVYSKVLKQISHMGKFESEYEESEPIRIPDSL